MKRIALLGPLALTPLAQAECVNPTTVCLPTPEPVDNRWLDEQMAKPCSFVPLPPMEDMPLGPVRKTLNIYNMGHGELQFHETYGVGSGGVKYHDYSGYDSNGRHGY